jgi:hypothetical protein
MSTRTILMDKTVSVEGYEPAVGKSGKFTWKEADGAKGGGFGTIVAVSETEMTVEIESKQEQHLPGLMDLGVRH